MNLRRSLQRAGLIAVGVSLANGQMANRPLTFEAASVKIADGNFVPRGTGKMKGGPGTTDPGRITFTQVGLWTLLLEAWEVEGYRIDGPGWLKNARESDWYDLTATMPPETTKQQFHVMLQNLLVERFQIKLHHETRNYPGYDLVVAPGGSKLRESADPDAPEPTTGVPTGADREGFPLLPRGHGKGVVMSSKGVYAKFQNCTLAELVHPYLESFIRQSTGAEINHVADRTGLGEKYDFTLKFDSRADSGTVLTGPGIRAGETSSAGSATEPSGLPYLFDALEKQLGLKLVPVRAFPLDTVVIDHIEKTPTAN